jgi:hypothetical protein
MNGAALSRFNAIDCLFRKLIQHPGLLKQTIITNQSEYKSLIKCRYLEVCADVGSY